MAVAPGQKGGAFQPVMTFEHRCSVRQCTFVSASRERKEDEVSSPQVVMHNVRHH